MSGYRPHGVSPDQVVNSRYFLRDTRHPTQRLADACRKPANLGVFCAIAAGLVCLLPALTDLGVMILLAVLVRAATLRAALPLKLPETCRHRDPHDPAPGEGDRGVFKPAGGVFFLGNERKTRKQLWQTVQDMLTHFLVMGGTGAGKTEAMLSMASQSVLQGSGFAYTDGKGDSSLWAKVFALLRACGREDDLYVINYMTASTTVDPDAPAERRLSN